MVFVIADDLGAMDTTATNPACFYDTPHIRSLADSGTRLTAGCAACPVCSPTRSAVMTGQWPARTRNTDYFGGPNQHLGDALRTRSPRNLPGRTARRRPMRSTPA